VNDVNGLLLIDKPAGLTSHDVVDKAREALNFAKIGHAGTLDPQATGLLVLALGEATRWLPYLPSDKRYAATLRLGIETDTEDIWGRELKHHDASGISDEALSQALTDLLQSKTQTPPMISALKHDGQRLYKLARQGVEVERKQRPVEIFGLEPGARRGDDMDFEVHCGSGTYVRSLCSQVGRALGVGACMAALRRTTVGAFDIKDAVKVDQISSAVLIGPEAALLHLKPYAVTLADEALLIEGRDLVFEEGDWDESETWRMIGSTGRLLALGAPRRLKGVWRMQPKRVFGKAKA
jgi:tRNA pseudouridine55 synthase